MPKGLQVLPFDETGSRSHRWEVIPAGGEGKRLLSLTQKFNGNDRLKQFSAMGSQTFPQLAQRRVSRLVKQWQTLPVLTRTQEQFYVDRAAGVPSASLVVQPQNKGTALAILYSLMRVPEMDPSYCCFVARC